MGTLLAFAIIIIVIVFGVWYPDYVKTSRGCSAVRGLRMCSLGGTFLFLLTADKEHPTYFVIVLILIAVAVIVFLLNLRDSKSWLHGIFMTLWQSLAVGFIIWVLFQLLGANNKKKNGGT